jgi:hypothetical protein
MIASFGLSTSTTLKMATTVPMIMPKKGQLAAVPMILPMGSMESQPMVCTVTETIVDLAN